MNSNQSNDQSPEYLELLSLLKKSIWWFGITAWVFGICDRSIATFSDGSLSAIDIMQLFTAAFFFSCWLLLKPTPEPVLSPSTSKF
ncbi:hypothetical protein [Leptolyngbya sp. FACHB-261]|uniref:hypothetical protein n=1 Tax=Leptolyngbya sp. FACHB-261 TaxID=2692806 RepID=UPI0018F021A6|nr:hypothetical protein [Leptolyngbya sp. FACHB-261]